MVRVRGIGVSITSPDGQEWRMAMIDAPIFPVSTPQGFYQLLTASGSKDPNAMKKFIGAHPEFLTFLGWAKSAPWTASYRRSCTTVSTPLCLSMVPDPNTQYAGH